MQIRVCTEHAIGLLKGRFQALHELQIQISSKKDKKWAFMFVCSCLVLHNLILHLKGGKFNTNFHEHLCEAGRHNVAPFPKDDLDDQKLLGS